MTAPTISTAPAITTVAATTITTNRFAAANTAPRIAMADQALERTRIEALFVSHLQRSEQASAETVRDAVATTVSRYGTQGCAALVAQEYGEHPETAIDRMRWAMATVRKAYSLG